MKYLATNEALTKLNEYGLTEHEIQQEFKGRLKLEKEGDLGSIVLNWKNKDIIVLAVGEKTAVLMQYGQEIKGSYEDFPEIKYKENKWVLK